ncbi:MAG: SH3 domain-containing protein [Chloroflexota bacterium]
MKSRSKLLSVTLLIVFSLGIMAWGQVASAAPAQQVQFVAPRLVVNSSFLNVRSGPGIQYPALITVVGGTELPVLARASDNVWFQVSTVIGVGWVNVQFTVPRGSFDNVPVVSMTQVASALPYTATTIGLGQGGGLPAPTTATIASTVPVTSSGRIRLDLGNGKVTTVVPGERYRAVLNVEAVNLRTQPFDGAPTLGTIFRDDTFDYPILGNAGDKKGVPWIAIEVADLGVGWIEAPKAKIRLSRAAGSVLVITANATSLTDAPNGSGNNLPVLSQGQEGFLVNISKDSHFVEIELGDGTRGWVPFSSTLPRTGTPTDQLDESQLASVTTASVAVPSTTTDTGVVIPSVPATFGLDVPHIVINTGFLNIRSGPGAQFSTVTTLSGGTELPVLGKAEDGVWLLVSGPFGQGWVNNDFVIFRGSMASVPVIHAAVGTLSTPIAIVSSSVTVYAAPGTNFGAIGTLVGPIQVPVVARTADSTWLQLNTSLGFGWVLASQVLLQGDGSTIPVVG